MRIRRGCWPLAPAFSGGLLVIPVPSPSSNLRIGRDLVSPRILWRTVCQHNGDLTHIWQLPHPKQTHGPTILSVHKLVALCHSYELRLAGIFACLSSPSMKLDYSVRPSTLEWRTAKLCNHISLIGATKAVGHHGRKKYRCLRSKAGGLQYR